MKLSTYGASSQLLALIFPCLDFLGKQRRSCLQDISRVDFPQPALVIWQWRQPPCMAFPRLVQIPLYVEFLGARVSVGEMVHRGGEAERGGGRGRGRCAESHTNGRVSGVEADGGSGRSCRQDNGQSIRQGPPRLCAPGAVLHQQNRASTKTLYGDLCAARPDQHSPLSPFGIDMCTCKG